MKKEFSEKLQKAIESGKIIIHESKKLAIINNPVLFMSENWGAELWKFWWNLGMQAELQSYDYYVVIE